MDWDEPKVWLSPDRSHPGPHLVVPVKIVAMLVGRDRELRRVAQALASARLGSSSRLLIRGDAGIGKTALVEYAIAGAGGMNVLAARGVEFEADVPFAGLHELLQPALGTLDRLPSRHASALRSSLGLGDRIEADRLIVGASVLGVISAHAEQAPLLVVLDEAQWLDRASADAVAFAARRLIADPVAVVVAVREGEDSPLLHIGMPELRLEGIDNAAATELLGGLGAAPLTADQVERLVRATGGNPLALLELARTEPQLSQPDDLPVATSVERAYLRRAAGISEDGRRALLILAASGTSDVRLVRRVAEEMAIAPAATDEAETAAGLVAVKGDRIQFVHPLAKAAIYHSASPADRRDVHSALARSLVDADSIDRRAWHLAAAASGWDSGAADALELAARRARESSGYDAAAGALAESARLTRDPELRARRRFAAAENAWLAGRSEKAVELLAEARKSTLETETIVDIDNLDGHIAMRRGAVMEGQRLMKAAAEAIAEANRLKAVRILADAAVSAYAAGHPETSLEAAAKAVDLLRPGDPADHAACALVAYGALAILAGRGAEGARRLHESVTQFDKLSLERADPLLLMCAGIAGLFIRDTRAQRDLLDRAVDQAREHAPAAALPSILFLLGRDAAATDRWPLARAQYEESARVARETTQFTWLAGAVAGLAWLDALEGKAEECRAHAAEARRLAKQYGMGFFTAWSMIALGQLELGEGRPEAALRHFSECSAFLEQVAIDDPDLSPLPDMVDALVRVGRRDEARAVSEHYWQAAEAKGQPFALARGLRARALVSGDAEFTSQFELALRHHDAASDVFERARTCLYFGERLRRTRRRVEARRQLRAALKVFDDLGASPWADRALAELQASGETARVRDDSHRQQLTPQELQVALTLAEGATTRGAAARLYLSPKTVEYHLRHVYDKLDIRTRDELRTYFLRQSPG